MSQTNRVNQSQQQNTGGNQPLNRDAYVNQQTSKSMNALTFLTTPTRRQELEKVLKDHFGKLYDINNNPQLNQKQKDTKKAQQIDKVKPSIDAILAAERREKGEDYTGIFKHYEADGYDNGSPRRNIYGFTQEEEDQYRNEMALLSMSLAGGVDSKTIESFKGQVSKEFYERVHGEAVKAEKEAKQIAKEKKVKQEQKVLKQEQERVAKARKKEELEKAETKEDKESKRYFAPESRKLRDSQRDEKAPAPSWVDLSIERNEEIAAFRRRKEAKEEEQASKALDKHKRHMEKVKKQKIHVAFEDMSGLEMIKRDIGKEQNFNA